MMVLLRKSLLPAATALGVTAAATFAALVGACSSSQAPITSGDSGADSGPSLLSAKCTVGGLTIAFNPMYSAFDGKHTFQIPAVVIGSNSQVTWFADSTMVGMQADTEQHNEVLITMLKAGNTTIHVQSKDGKCGSSPLTITPALESDWEIGNARYNDGVSAHVSGAAPPPGSTGSPLEPQLDGGGPACTNCHGETATAFAFTNVSHTPEQTGGFSDQEIIDLVTKGIWPAHDTFDSNIVMQGAWMNFHRWADITPDQQRGIVVYLRSLTPAHQKGAKNFGAFDDSGAASVVTEAAAPDDGGSADGDAGAGEASATD